MTKTEKLLRELIALPSKRNGRLFGRGASWSHLLERNHP
jgi:hypothetical protein